MQPTIITSGRKYLDIDALASMIGYRELLRACGKKQVYAVSTAPCNQSVSPSLRPFYQQLDQPQDFSRASFVMIDVSNPDFFDTFVQEGQIAQVIDHHAGFEAYWQAKLGDQAQIEFIGSVCTMIFERIVALDKLDILSSDLCRLLSAGILDNTLNFHSEITTERDHLAYTELVRHGRLERDWPKVYFEECFVNAKQDLAGAIRDDLKVEQVSPLLPETVGQLIVPQIKDFDQKVLMEVFANTESWLMNVISLIEGKSYLYFAGAGVQENLERLFGVKAENSYIILQPCQLRKQIFSRARDLSI